MESNIWWWKLTFPYCTRPNFARNSVLMDIARTAWDANSSMISQRPTHLFNNKMDKMPHKVRWMLIQQHSPHHKPKWRYTIARNLMRLITLIRKWVLARLHLTHLAPRAKLTLSLQWQAPSTITWACSVLKRSGLYWRLPELAASATDKLRLH